MEDLIVVGGGVAALAFALAAAKRGRRLRLLKKAAPAGGRYFALGRRGRNFLNDLGVSPPLLPVHQFQLFAGSLSLPLSAGRGSDEALCHIVAEEDLLRRLNECLTAANVRQSDCAAIAWRRTDADAVHLLADETPLHAALLVAADGARSPLAGQLGIFADHRDFKQTATVAVVRSSSLPPHTAMQWFAADDIVALLPIGEERFSLIWSSAKKPPSAAPALTEQLRRRCGRADIAVDESAAVHAFPLHAARRAVRTASRTVFLGDAAQRIHPMAGQGMNLGLADAACLATCLRRRRDVGAAAALAAYAAVSGGRGRCLDATTALFAHSAAAPSLALALGHAPGVRRFARWFANA